jgi:histidine triad (HIT) family protein
MSDFYCDEVISGNLEVDVVFETERVLVFEHTDPFFERHLVIIPKEHIESLSSPEALDPALAAEFLRAIHHATTILESEWGGCRVSSNVGNYQSSKHLHWYVHSGRRLRSEDGTHIRT